MRDFYGTLSQYYDRLFPMDEQITAFLEQTFFGIAGSTIIDAACGTGAYTEALARREYDCLGFDADERMIAIARDRRSHGRYHVARLEELAATVRNLRTSATRGNVGGILCIGNSLPHLPDRKAIRRFFLDGASLLQGGVLVVQTINFSRFHPSRTPLDLPPIVRDEIRMYRSYRPADTPGSVLFHITLEPHNGKAVDAQTRLLALEDEELVEFATDAGFTRLTTYGSYDRSPLDRERSFLTVLVAQ